MLQLILVSLHGISSLVGVEVVPGTPQIITGDIEGIFKVRSNYSTRCSPSSV